MPITRIAACHVAPVFLSARKTTEKAVKLIHEAAKHKANVIVFPETYIPAFPIWSSLRPPSENHDLFQRMVHESIYIDGDEIHAIRAAAKATKTVVSLGFSEKSHFSTATLYNSNLMISDNDNVLVHHRKLMPTFFEKLTWSPGDGHGLHVYQSPYGKIGQLICGENTNPLARYALMAQGEQIHISSWPAIWPTHVPAGATVGGGGKEIPSGGRMTNYDNLAANHIRAACHCFEAKCFGVVCAGYLDRQAIETITAGLMDAGPVIKALEESSQAATFFLDPSGVLFPAFTASEETGEQQHRDLLQLEEGILYADLDLDKCIEGKQYHDVVGGYQRLDVFQLQVNRTRLEPVVFTETFQSKGTETEDE
ncbi:carbon-nitrogen hydrolase [Aspergillus leporis]|uniref:Carbon-nitrogen hydrolase n=1 Tax=Aspergillus leporis TaxID=41062 RepID=A0A5N5X5C7_9EURO|nr:carbon-nitrogen hydrolase [Aspergillus leporis]